MYSKVADDRRLMRKLSPIVRLIGCMSERKNSCNSSGSTGRVFSGLTSHEKKIIRRRDLDFNYHQKDRRSAGKKHLEKGDNLHIFKREEVNFL